MLVPTQVTREISTREFDITNAFGIHNVEVGGELTVPFKAAKIEAD